MKLSLKSLNYAIWLAYIYTAALVVQFVLKDFYENEFLAKHPVAIWMTLQVIYCVLLIYLTIILINYQQHSAAINAFKYYIGSALLIFVSYLISVMNLSYYFTAGVGLVMLFVIVNLAIQVRKLTHPVLAKQYKILVVMIIATLVIKGLMSFAFSYLLEYYNFQIYNYVRIYSDIYIFFVPVEIIVIFHKTAALILNPENIEQPEEQYL